MLTGAGGFLGQNVVGRLVDAGHEVVAISSQSEPELRKVWGLPGTSDRLHDVRVVDRAGAADSSLLEHIDVLVNAGFPRAGSGSELAEGLDHQRQLFEAAHASAVGRVINLSSQSVYGLNRSSIAREGDPEALDSTYAGAKYASELLANSILLDAEVSHLRLASLIGPGFPYRLVNKMIARALAGEAITIIRSEQRFDFMDVRDAADALVDVVGTPNGALPQLLNVGSSNPLTLEEIAVCISETVAEERGIVASVTQGEGEGKANTSALNCELLFQCTGFRPRYDLADTVRQILRVDYPV